MKERKNNHRSSFSDISYQPKMRSFWQFYKPMKINSKKEQSIKQSINRLCFLYNHSAYNIENYSSTILLIYVFVHVYCSLQLQEVAARARWSSKYFLDNICKWRLPRKAEDTLSLSLSFYSPVVLLSCCCVKMLETFSHTNTHTHIDIPNSCSQFSSFSLFHVLRSLSYIPRIQNVKSIHLSYVICCSLKYLYTLFPFVNACTT